MINFIIYEDEKKFREKYISVILKAIGNKNIAYDILEIEKYTKATLSEIKKLTGKKIYIFDVEVPGKSGLDLAREIRNSGDWISPMIVVSTHEHLRTPAFTSKMLMLDFISKFYDCEENLLSALKVALEITDNHKSLNFQCNGELLQIPYEDILFVEKNVDDLYSTIITESGRIGTNLTIISVEKELCQYDKFIRAHRSYIVNLDKITSVELKECIIHFGQNEQALLSRDKKPELKSKLNKNLIITKVEEKTQ